MILRLIFDTPLKYQNYCTANH